MTAFAQALDVVFIDPNLSTPALYQQAGIGMEQAIRVMRRSPDRMVEFGLARLVSDSVVLDVRISNCPDVNGRVKVSQRAAQNVATLGLG